LNIIKYPEGLTLLKNMTDYSFLAAGSQRRGFGALPTTLFPRQITNRMAGKAFEHCQGEPLANIRLVWRNYVSFQLVEQRGKATSIPVPRRRDRWATGALPVGETLTWA